MYEAFRRSLLGSEVMVGGRIYPHEDASIPFDLGRVRDNLERARIDVRKTSVLLPVTIEFLEDADGFWRVPTWSERANDLLPSYYLRNRIRRWSAERWRAVRAALAIRIYPEGRDDE